MSWSFGRVSSSRITFFLFFLSPFSEFFYFRLKQGKQKSAEWHSDCRTSPLVSQWDIYTNIPPWTSLFCIFEGSSSPNTHIVSQSTDLQRSGAAARTPTPGTQDILPSHSGLLRAECCASNCCGRSKAIRKRRVSEPSFCWNVFSFLETRAPPPLLYLCRADSALWT